MLWSTSLGGRWTRVEEKEAEPRAAQLDYAALGLTHSAAVAARGEASVYHIQVPSGSLVIILPHAASLPPRFQGELR